MHYVKRGSEQTAWKNLEKAEAKESDTKRRIWGLFSNGARMVVFTPTPIKSVIPERSILSVVQIPAVKLTDSRFTVKRFSRRNLSSESQISTPSGAFEK